jgi:TPR repeat protein
MNLLCDGANPKNVDVDQAYANGEDAERGNDNTLALCWYRIAADEGSAAAMGRIGFIYDSDQASHVLPVTMRWYKASAEGGNSPSIVGILQIHDQGRYPVDQAWGQSLFDQLMKIKTSRTILCNNPKIYEALLQDLDDASSDPGVKIWQFISGVAGFVMHAHDVKIDGARFVRSDDNNQFVCEAAVGQKETEYAKNVFDDNDEWKKIETAGGYLEYFTVRQLQGNRYRVTITGLENSLLPTNFTFTRPYVFETTLP